MKKPILLSLLFVLCLSCSSEKNSVSGKYLKKYMNTISEESLKTDLTIVASDEMEGRETGSEGQKRAGKYLISQYEKNGISFPKGADSFYQKVPAAFLNAKKNENKD